MWPMLSMKDSSSRVRHSFERALVTAMATFQVTVDGDRALLVIEGELDFAACEGLTAVTRDLERVPFSVLNVDVARVSFVDCSALRELDRSRREAEAAGRRVRIRAAGPAFLRVARLARYPELAQLDELTTGQEANDRAVGSSPCRQPSAPNR
jgi:anti-anti-sigma regulatory factor